jgi:uncharacterized protein YggE
MATDLDPAAAEPGTVRVRGTASRWVPADVADVTFTVSRQARTSGVAVTEAGAAYGALDAALSAHADVIVRRTTTSLSVHKVVRYDPKSGREVPEGFVGSRSLTVRFRAVEAAGNALRAAVASAPDLQVAGPDFALEPQNPVHAAVRAEAAAAARASAEAYASGLGLELGRVLRLREPDTATDGYAPGAAGGGGMAIRAFAKSAGAPVPDGGESVLVDLGREDVEVVVDVELTATLVDPA